MAAPETVDAVAGRADGDPNVRDFGGAGTQRLRIGAAVRPDPSGRGAGEDSEVPLVAGDGGDHLGGPVDSAEVGVRSVVPHDHRCVLAREPVADALLGTRPESGRRRGAG